MKFDAATTEAKFIEGLDLQSSRWPVEFATRQDLEQFMYMTVYHFERGDINDVATSYQKLRRSVAQRLFLAVRAAYDACLVKEAE